MKYSELWFIFLPMVIYVGIALFLLYLIFKWVMKSLEYKQAQNEILRDLVKTVDRALEKRNPAP